MSKLKVSTISDPDNDNTAITVSNTGAITVAEDATFSGDLSCTDLSFDSGYGSAATAYGCRAWVNFNGTGTVAIRDSGNVSSITDNGTGDYTVNFTNAMPDANYSYLGGAQAYGIANGPMIDMYYGGSTTTAARFRVFTQAAAAMDTSYASIAVFR